MVIKVVPKFSQKKIREMIAERLLRIDKALVLRLKRVGENFVKNARSTNSYKDQTGNLRNSIGYVILRDGVQLAMNFRRSAAVSTGERTSRGSRDGVNAGRDLAIEVAQKFPRGYVLICVAGMEYAAAVEARGLDVITASSQIAEEELKRSLLEITRKLDSAA